MIGIIAAMNEEIIILEKQIEKASEKNIASMKFICGKIDGVDITAVVSGIGKVNAGICAQILIDIFKVDTIINVGIAGAVKEGIKTGDIVIAEKLVQHDVDVTGFGYKKGQIPGIEVLDFASDPELIEISKEIISRFKDSNVYSGTIASGDQFINSLSRVLEIEKEYGAIACEMEGASIAHVCHLNNIKCIVIRSISDNARDDASIIYEEFKNGAIEKSTKFLLEVIKSDYFKKA